ncbi:MAG TPA: hypothetical protein VGR16_07470 [Thermomicrobiales bacterium]|nr:hypothetical protein [Thermomicrobiales bacterium]
MRFELTASGLLHMHFGDGVAVDTITLADLIYLEIDSEGHPLSLDFVVAEDFLPFIKERGGVFEIPPRVDPDMTDAFGSTSHPESPVVTH